MSLDLHALAAAARTAAARIAPHVERTPVLPSRALGARLGLDLRFKAENFQRTGSFKVRGATARLTALPPGAAVVTASSGNHGIACAAAARATGARLTVVLPETVAAAKRARIEAMGADVVIHGAEAGLAEAYARGRARSEGAVYVSPYNDPEVMAGQGTVAVELLEQMEAPDAVFVAMGGGGLISGIGAVLKAARPGVRVIGVAAARSAALAAAMRAGRVVEVEHGDTLADGVAGGIDADTLTLPVAMRVVDEVVTCAEDEIVAALRAYAWEERQLVEGSAALALAGLMQRAADFAGRRVVVVTCGANFDERRLFPIVFANDAAAQDAGQVGRSAQVEGTGGRR